MPGCSSDQLMDEPSLHEYRKGEAKKLGGLQGTNPAEGTKFQSCFRKADISIVAFRRNQNGFDCDTKLKECQKCGETQNVPLESTN